MVPWTTGTLSCSSLMITLELEEAPCELTPISRSRWGVRGGPSKASPTRWLLLGASICCPWAPGISRDTGTHCCQPGILLQSLSGGKITRGACYLRRRGSRRPHGSTPRRICSAAPPRNARSQAPASAGARSSCQRTSFWPEPTQTGGSGVPSAGLCNGERLPACPRL